MQPLDDWLSALGFAEPARPPMALLEAAEYYEDRGDDDRAALARRGWLWTFDNDYFDQMYGPDGAYALQLGHIFERAGVSVDAVDNYFSYHDGTNGVVVRIRRGVEETCFFKRTDGFNDLCHCDLLFAAATHVLQEAGADVELVLLEEDVIVEIAVIPREASNAVLARMEVDPWKPQVRGGPCRQITSAEARTIIGE